MFLCQKNATPGEGGQKDIMSRMAEIFNCNYIPVGTFLGITI